MVQAGNDADLGYCGSTGDGEKGSAQPLCPSAGH